MYCNGHANVHQTDGTCVLTRLLPLASDNYILLFVSIGNSKLRISVILRSRQRAVGIATGHALDVPRGRSSSPGRVKNFLFSTSSRGAMGSTQPPIQWVPGALSPEVKRSGREAGHSPPTSAEVKKTLIYASTPPYVLMVKKDKAIPVTGREGP
jgi:hypothetical protein